MIHFFPQFGNILFYFLFLFLCHFNTGVTKWWWFLYVACIHEILHKPSVKQIAFKINQKCAKTINYQQPPEVTEVVRHSFTVLWYIMNITKIEKKILVTYILKLNLFLWQFYCLIFLWKAEEFFQDSMINRKFKRIAFIWSRFFVALQMSLLSLDHLNAE